MSHLLLDHQPSAFPSVHYPTGLKCRPDARALVSRSSHQASSSRITRASSTPVSFCFKPLDKIVDLCLRRCQLHSEGELGSDPGREAVVAGPLGRMLPIERLREVEQPAGVEEGSRGTATQMEDQGSRTSQFGDLMDRRQPASASGCSGHSSSPATWS